MRSPCISSTTSSRRLGGAAEGTAGSAAELMPLSQSPRLMPRSRTMATMSESSGTFLGRPTTSARGTRVIVGPLSPTMTPKHRSAIARTAAAPIRSAGAPPLHQDDVAVPGPRPLGDDDDAEPPPHGFAVADLVAHLFDLEGDLRQQD